MTSLHELIEATGQGHHRLSHDEAVSLASCGDLPMLTTAAARLRDLGFGGVMTYSRKVFIPLTQLCRDVCHYCTFAHPPRKGERAFLTPDEVLEIARKGAEAGCREALFTLGDQPERRYRVAREELAELGFETTLDYLRHCAQLVLENTSLLPHLNPGLLTAEDYPRLRPISASMGIMLESASPRLSARGMPHFGSPDKDPARRLETIRLAGEAAVPFTSGILIGIGETRVERIQSILALRDLHEAHGHIQEIIVQNFRAKPNTKMAGAPEPDLDELRWTLAVARLILGPEMSLQAPPNLSPGMLDMLVEAGINDWGGVSPITPDHVNPEAPWPHLARLARDTAASGKLLQERLTIYPAYASKPERWLDPALRRRVMEQVDGQGMPRFDGWMPGSLNVPPAAPPTIAGDDLLLLPILARARDGQRVTEGEAARLFTARGRAFDRVCETADELRREVNGDDVSYVVTRNINYTNVCSYKCQFCAFSKGKLSENLRGKPYVLDDTEIVRRVEEAWARGATEVCMQGGIHPAYTGDTYVELCRTVKAAVPDMHVHAFSPLEVTQGAATLGLPLPEFLARLKEAGLGTLPGTAAEVLDDEVRAILCPDKLNTDAWLRVIEAAHNVGFRTTATIMFGHVDGYVHWARHLLRLRDLHARTGGFTEFVPLPFVAMEAPIYLKGRARPGPTWREAILMHAVPRIVLHTMIPNIQTSWVKMGPEGVRVCLSAGANDLGGTLMNETITRSAGAIHGEEMAPELMEELIRAAGRNPRQRTTLYADAEPGRVAASFGAAPLSDVINRPARDYERARA